MARQLFVAQKQWNVVWLQCKVDDFDYFAKIRNLQKCAYLKRTKSFLIS